MITLAANTDGGAAYADFASAEAALPASPADDYEITLAGVANDTTPVTIDGTGFSGGGFTCEIKPAPGNWHLGEFDENKYLHSSSTDGNLNVRDNGIICNGFQLRNTNGGSRSVAGIGNSSEAWFVHLYMENNKLGSSDGCFFVNGSSAIGHLHGCIMKGATGNAASLVRGTLYAEGNLADDSGTAYACASGYNFTLTNSIGINCTAFASGAFQTGSGNNATDLASMGYTGGTNDITNLVIADNFTDAANGDYSILDTSAAIYQAGTALNYLTDGVAENAYLSPPSVGPHEFAGAGTTPVSNDLSLQWNALGRATQDSDLRWQLLNIVDSDLSLAWNALVEVSQDEQLAWNVLVEVTNTADIRWDLLALITNDIGLQWQILQAVQNDSQLAWQMLMQASNDIGIAWTTLQALAADLNIDWHVRARVEQPVDLRWDMQSALSAVSNDLGLSWDIESALTPVSNDLAIRYDIRHQIVQALDARWDMLETVGMDLDMRWHIATAVAADLALAWNQYQDVSNTSDLRWDALELVDGSVTFHWTLDGLALTPISIMRIPAERRLIPVPAERRVIPIHTRR